MTLPDSGFSIETLTLPHEDPAEHRRLASEWLSAYPSRNPVVRGFVQQVVVAQIEKRRLERVRAALRAERVRTALLDFDRRQEDDVYRCLSMFNVSSKYGESCEIGFRGLTRSAAGCRWAIAEWERLQALLAKDGTWYGADRIAAIQLQGFPASIDLLYIFEAAYMTWLDCLVAQPNPKQKDIDKILDPIYIPKSIQDRDDVQLWPGNPAESRARLQALVDCELPWLRALEETLRVQYEAPARAAAQDLALAEITKEEASLLRAERMHEQSYVQAVTALQKVCKQTAVSPERLLERELPERAIVLGPRVTRPENQSVAGGLGPGPWGVGKTKTTQPSGRLRLPRAPNPRS